MQHLDPTPCAWALSEAQAVAERDRVAVALEPGHEARVARWALRRILNKLAQLFALAAPPVDLDHRASGSVVCEMCGEEYRRHAGDPHDPSGTTTMLCDGRRVHL